MQNSQIMQKVEGKKVRAYYGIGGVSPITTVKDIIDQSGIPYEDFTLQETQDFSALCLQKKITDTENPFPEAKEWIDKITTYLWETLWKQTEAGHTYEGVEVWEEWEDAGKQKKEWCEFYNDEGEDFTDWEASQEEDDDE